MFMKTQKYPRLNNRTLIGRQLAYCLLLWLLQTPLTMQANADSTVYKHREADGTVTFSDAPIINGQIVRSSYRNQYGRQLTTNSCSGLTTRQLDARGMSFLPAIRAVASSTSLKPHWIMAVARVESCFDARAVSRAGAQGLMQLMPATARDVGVQNSFDAMQNLKGGARYLDAMKRRFGDMELALAAYNAGPGTVDKYQGIPPYPETTRYIELVKQFAKSYKRHFDASQQASRP